DDGLYPLETARRLVRELPRARLRELPGCGHLPHQQCTGAFLEALFEQLELDPPAGEPDDPGAGESPDDAGAPEGRPDDS
ncbi:MAG: alpha/beta hydrolase, partial [Acidobacteriota bacterium]